MSLTIIGSGGVAFGAGGTAFGVSASYAAYGPAPVPPPWFVFDSRHPEHVSTSGQVDGLDRITTVSDLNGGAVSFTAQNVYAMLAPPDAAINNHRPMRTSTGGYLVSSAPFPPAGADVRFLAMVVKLTGQNGNIAGYGGLDFGQLFDLLVQSGPVLGVHYYGNNPAVEGNARPFATNQYGYISTRVTDTGALRLRINTAWAEVPGPLSTVASPLRWGGGALQAFDSGDAKDWSYFRADTAPPSLAEEDALYAELAAAFNLP